MKTFISLSALFLSLSLTATLHSQIWFFNDSSIYGIETTGNTASGDFSTAMGWQTTASGTESTAMGRGTTALGTASTAMGLNTTASGSYSTAMGLNTTASAFASIAMGDHTEASGSSSTAMGQSTIAWDMFSLVIGRFNLVGSTETNTEFSLDNTAFVIGNGTDSNSRSDALVVKFNGDATLAGSMTATSFIGDGSQLTNLLFSYNSNEAGGIEVADYTTASGSRAFAVGNDNLASGSSSTAMGRGTIASGDDSTAIGANTEASGDYSTAMGYQTQASGNLSTAMGENTEASGIISTAIGFNSNATGPYSVAIGATNNSSGYASTTLGDSNSAIGRASTAIGAGTIAEDFGMLSIGVWSSPLSQPNPNQFSYNNTALLIGNGPDADNRSNALQVLFDGTTTIAGDLNVNSDARLKANIVSLGATLSKLLQIDGKSYTMKKDESEKQKIGLLAQDIEKVFPELVSESNGIKSVNYQGLVPVLINALKEQEEKIKSQENKLLELESLVQDLIDNQ